MNEPKAVAATPQGVDLDTQGVAVDANPVSQGVAADANPVPQAVAADANSAPQGTAPDYRAMYENLRRENEILRHNADIAQRAPVQGVSGGGAVAAPVDDFTRGFDSDTWGD